MESLIEAFIQYVYAYLAFQLRKPLFFSTNIITGLSIFGILGIPKIGPPTYYDIIVTNCVRNAHFSTEKHMNKIDTST